MSNCKQCGHECHCDPKYCKDGCICADCNCKKNKPLELKKEPTKNMWNRFLDWLLDRDDEEKKKYLAEEQALADWADSFKEKND